MTYILLFRDVLRRIRYGFHKINKSPRGQRGSNEYEVWEFSHKNFQRDNPTLLEDIKRKTMDSELLRRENGDVHASLATMQQYQADLLRQFKALQENYSNLLQNMEEMKKTQDQQQATIRKLLDYATQTSSSKYEYTIFLWSSLMYLLKSRHIKICQI